MHTGAAAYKAGTLTPDLDFLSQLFTAHSTTWGFCNFRLFEDKEFVAPTAEAALYGQHLGRAGGVVEAHIATFCAQVWTIQNFFGTGGHERLILEQSEVAEATGSAMCCEKL